MKAPSTKHGSVSKHVSKSLAALVLCMTPKVYQPSRVPFILVSTRDRAQLVGILHQPFFSQVQVSDMCDVTGEMGDLSGLLDMGLFFQLRYAKKNAVWNFISANISTGTCA